MSDQDRQEAPQFVMTALVPRDHHEGPGVLIRPGGAMSAAAARLVGAVERDPERPDAPLSGVSMWVFALTGMFMVGTIMTPFPWPLDGAWRLLHGAALAAPPLIIGYLLARAARARCQRDGAVIVREETTGAVLVESYGGRLNTSLDVSDDYSARLAEFIQPGGAGWSSPGSQEAIKAVRLWALEVLSVSGVRLKAPLKEREQVAIDALAAAETALAARDLQPKRPTSPPSREQERIAEALRRADEGRP